MVEEQAQILAKSDYDSFYWIGTIAVDPEPSRFARCLIEINWVMFEVQNAHHLHSSLFFCRTISNWSIQISVSYGNIALFKAKVGADLKKELHASDPFKTTFM